MAAVFAALYLAPRFEAAAGRRHSFWTLVTAGARAAYVVWEALILAQSPEANIRVDILRIYPLLGAFTAWALFRSYR